MADIREIRSTDSYGVRHPVLRTGLPVESCRFDGDDLPGTKHFGIYESGALVGVVSVFECRSQSFDQSAQFQLRGMAVLDEHRKKGLGEELLTHAESHIIMRAAELIWFNARIAAVPFYQRNGYKIKGELFDIPGVGPHYLMFKELH